MGPDDQASEDQVAEIGPDDQGERDDMVVVQVKAGRVFGVSLPEVLDLQHFLCKAGSEPSSPERSSSSKSQLNSSCPVLFTVSRDDARLPMVLIGAYSAPSLDSHVRQISRYPPSHQPWSTAFSSLAVLRQLASSGEWGSRESCLTRTERAPPETNVSSVARGRVPGKKATMDAIRERFNSGVYHFEEGSLDHTATVPSQGLCALL